MPDINERNARAMLSYLTEPADVEVGEQVRTHGAVDTVEQLYYSSHSRIAERLGPRWPRGITPVALEPLYQELLSRSRRPLRFVIPGDAEWPVGLGHLGTAAPYGLWVDGDFRALEALNSRPAVAIVGARAATSYGEHVAMELASDLANGHITIVSGAAYGIDGAAHRAALAVDAFTVAFLAGGVDRPYPAGHANLLDRIAKVGAVVSEVPPGSAPTKWRFLARNRLIAASTGASIVVEAGYRSGSLNEASHARELGRPVGAVPGPITSAASAGCHHLIREGAICITSADDIRELLNMKEASNV